MATIVNNPSSNSSGAGWGIAVVLAVLVVLALVIGVPALRDASAPAAVDVNVGGQ